MSQATQCSTHGHFAPFLLATCPNAGRVAAVHVALASAISPMRSGQGYCASYLASRLRRATLIGIALGASRCAEAPSHICAPGSAACLGLSPDARARTLLDVIDVEGRTHRGRCQQCLDRRLCITALVTACVTPRGRIRVWAGAFAIGALYRKCFTLWMRPRMPFARAIPPRRPHNMTGDPTHRFSSSYFQMARLSSHL